MLMLDRKNREAVVLRDRKTGRILATVTVSTITGHRATARVKLGFESPDDVQILREELIRRETP